MAEHLTVTLDQLVPDPNNPRTRVAVTDIKELAASIQAEGLLEPLMVRTNGEGVDTFHIISGHRRFAALGLLADAGVTFPIDVMVRADTDEAGVSILQLIENLQRVDLDPIDEADALARLVNDHAMKIKDVGTRIGRSQSHVSKRVALARLPEVAKKLVRIGELSVELAYEMAKMCPDYEDQVAELARSGNLHSGSIGYLQRSVEEAKKRERIFAALAAAGHDDVIDAGVVDYNTNKVVQQLGVDEIPDIKLGEEDAHRFVTVKFYTYKDPEILVFEPLPKRKLDAKAKEQQTVKAAERERNKAYKDEKAQRLERAIVIAKRPVRKDVLPMVLDSVCNRLVWQLDSAKELCTILELDPVVKMEDRLDKGGATIPKEVPDWRATLEEFLEGADEAKKLRLAWAGLVQGYVMRGHYGGDDPVATYIEANTEIVEVEPEAELVAEAPAGETVDLGTERKKRRGRKATESDEAG